MVTADLFGRAIRDHYLGERNEPLVDRNGSATRVHPIEEFYFGAVTGESDKQQWVDSWLDGPLLDMGAGVGSEALYWQEQYETVAIEISNLLVKTMRDRGVENAVQADMFSLPDSFERNQFASVHAKGTQVELAGSMQGLRRFLGDLAVITKPNATAVIDFHDPEHEDAGELFGYRDDPTRGLAYRLFHCEYEGAVGKTLLFRLFSPARLRDATIGTGWELSDIRRSNNGYHYRAALTRV
ncbi:type 11 methyltransferase [Halostagnicola larsenii XH-48]|uniref:Type 11 methyltransferase n=1 Tax=Halostagnicola larsenii XH-48 TaxID=797299 RepID=W0JT67_9EURY|nr:methyltransferase domain-containing protein [Halostagnicola larsenii]AHG00218.1 type 11 methyltransferase [Halostagnicola larsenii XH-48]